MSIVVVDICNLKNWKIVVSVLDNWTHGPYFSYLKNGIEHGGGKNVNQIYILSNGG